MNHTRLERSLKLLRAVNRFRVTFVRYPEHTRAELVYFQRELAIWDAECLADGQRNLLTYVPRPAPPKPNACEECGAFRPADFASIVDGEPVWLCTRCRDGRFDDATRRQLSVYDQLRRQKAAAR